MISPVDLHWPDAINPERFLSDYWQRKPLLIRQAFPGFKNPITPDELAGLALDQDIASRLIIKQSETLWLLRHGPFSEREFAGLPASDWSLLVSDIEKHLPDFIQYLEPFRFIPDWRIDDLMISYAPRGGSVGPHIDQYDVFLLQASGEREWRIHERPIENPQLLPDLELKILRQFTATQIHRLRAGDMLYLPPGIAHYGLSLDDQCMTWSFGFRAPSAAAMIAGYSQFVAERVSENLLYRDEDLVQQNNPGEITPQAIKQLFTMLKDNYTADETLFAEWIGRFLTESGGSGWIGVAPEKSNNLLSAIVKAEKIHRCTQSRLAYISGDERCNLFANGEVYSCSPELAHTLCASYLYSTEKLAELAGDTQNLSVLNSLYQQQILLIDN